MPKDHPNYTLRFSRSDSKNSRFTYFRILDPETGVSQSSRRIIQDVDRRWTEHIRAIVKDKGCCVRGLGSRVGIRRKVDGVEKWGGGGGGIRVKGDALVVDRLHRDGLPNLF